VLFLAAIIATVSASGITKSFIQAETAAVKIEANAEYFSGAQNMRTMEVTRASSNTFLGIADFILTALVWLLVILLAYNGGLAVYKYFKLKEKKNEES
jgi:hypothetical protein